MIFKRIVFKTLVYKVLGTIFFVYWCLQNTIHKLVNYNTNLRCFYVYRIFWAFLVDIWQTRCYTMYNFYNKNVT